MRLSGSLILHVKMVSNHFTHMLRGAKSLFPLTNLGFCPNQVQVVFHGGDDPALDHLDKGPFLDTDLPLRAPVQGRSVGAGQL